MIDLSIYTSDTLPYQKHSATSKEAAGLERKRQRGLRWEILELFKTVEWGGFTDEELYECFHLRKMPPKESTVRVRRVGLVDDGYVVKSGATRLTRSGHKATVWKWTRKE